MNNLQEQGRAHYKRGQYQEALSYFNRAIGRASTVQLLDNRAACYEKLNDLPSALKDAKAAIQLHREDATGYLRAGKVLVKMEKHGVAFEIYMHGLKCIKHVGQGYELLRKVHKELMDQLSPPKSVDPLTVLPRELAELILSYLSFRQRMNACLVTTQWARFIRSAPSLWRHLDLSGAKRKVRTAFISRAINVGRSKLTAATLNYLYDFDKTIAALVKHCPLEEMNLLQCGYQSRNLIQLLTPAKRLKRITLGEGTQLSLSEFKDLIKLGHLEALECGFSSGSSVELLTKGTVYPNFKSLSMRFIGSPTHSQLANLAECLPALEYLTISQRSSTSFGQFRFDLSCCSRLRHVDLSLALPRASLILLPESIFSLRLAPTLQAHGPTYLEDMINGSADCYYLPKLEEFTLDASTPIEHLLCMLADKEKTTDGESPGMSYLRRLSLKDSQGSRESFAQVFRHERLKKLECLSLEGVQKCNDDAVADIITCLPQLRSLDLSATEVTGVGIKEAVSKGHLEELVLHDCRHLGRDAVDWARSQGIAVRSRISTEAFGGRKVRY